MYAIVDRRDGAGGKLEYKVKWFGHEYLTADTWEPRVWLMKFKFSRELKMVDEWKMSTEPDFFRFIAGRGIELGDSQDGFCAFRALERAAALLGHPKWYSAETWASFIQERFPDGPATHSAGFRWEVVRDFVHAQNRASQQSEWELSEKSVTVKWLVDSVRLTTPLIQLAVPGGVYICAFYSSLRRRHCFVLEIISSQYFVHDDDADRTTSDCNADFWKRDVNATLNILNLIIQRETCRLGAFATRALHGESPL